jgi:hypothetical protein
MLILAASMTLTSVPADRTSSSALTRTELLKFGTCLSTSQWQLAPLAEPTVALAAASHSMMTPSSQVGEMVSLGATIDTTKI